MAGVAGGRVQKLVDLVIDHSHGLISLTKLQAIGAVVLAGLALQLVLDLGAYVYCHFLRPGKNLKRLGDWAVVTGATDGIGKAMAFEFASKSLSVVLISRSQDKLVATAEELKAKFPKVEVKVLAIDYGSFDEKARKLVADLLAQLSSVAVLVNNVGISYEFPVYFHELTADRVDKLMTINVHSTTWMTHLVLPKMVERKKGAVVNISSAAGVANSPLLAEYGAAKSYVSMFSRALNFEYAPKGVHVQCQVPMFVTTKLAKLRHTSIFVCSEKAYARAAVKAIGYEPLISPYWSHAIQIWISQVLPEWFIGQWVTLPMHQGIRAKGLKKQTAADSAKSK